MDVETLVAVHPELYHMADPRNLGSILQRGLLSTSALLDLYGVVGEQREAIESQHRPTTIPIEHPNRPIAYVRDQRPMDVSGLLRSLTDATPREFFEFLNDRVFFWLTHKRLATMNAAAAYDAIDQIVFTLDTASALAAHHRSVLLSPMNSGATRPMPHPRSIAMFKPIGEFDWEMKRPKGNRVVELTIAHRVPDFMDHVIRVEGRSSARGTAPIRGWRLGEVAFQPKSRSRVIAEHQGPSRTPRTSRTCPTSPAERQALQCERHA